MRKWAGGQRQMIEREGGARVGVRRLSRLDLAGAARRHAMHRLRRNFDATSSPVTALLILRGRWRHTTQTLRFLVHKYSLNDILSNGLLYTMYSYGKKEYQRQGLYLDAQFRMPFRFPFKKCTITAALL